MQPPELQFVRRGEEEEEGGEEEVGAVWLSTPLRYKTAGTSTAGEENVKQAKHW